MKSCCARSPRAAFFRVFWHRGPPGRCLQAVFCDLRALKSAANSHRITLCHSPCCPSTGLGVLVHHPLPDEFPYAALYADEVRKEKCCCLFPPFNIQHGLRKCGTWQEPQRGGPSAISVKGCLCCFVHDPRPGNANGVSCVLGIR